MSTIEIPLKKRSLIKTINFTFISIDEVLKSSSKFTSTSSDILTLLLSMVSDSFSSGEKNLSSDTVAALLLLFLLGDLLVPSRQDNLTPVCNQEEHTSMINAIYSSELKYECNDLFIEQDTTSQCYL